MEPRGAASPGCHRRSLEQMQLLCCVEAAGFRYGDDLGIERQMGLGILCCVEAAGFRYSDGLGKERQMGLGILCCLEADGFRYSREVLVWCSLDAGIKALLRLY